MPETEAPSPPDAAAGRLPLFNVVGFTGHRQLADPEAAARAIREALASLLRDLPGEWIALSSIARGSDQLFIAAAGAAGMSWHCILPLARSEFARDFSPAVSALRETRYASRRATSGSSGRPTMVCRVVTSNSMPTRPSASAGR